jgi:hypothetical protein
VSLCQVKPKIQTNIFNNNNLILYTYKPMALASTLYTNVYAPDVKVQRKKAGNVFPFYSFIYLALCCKLFKRQVLLKVSIVLGITGRESMR